MRVLRAGGGVRHVFHAEQQDQCVQMVSGTGQGRAGMFLGGFWQTLHPKPNLHGCGKGAEPPFTAS